MLQTKFDQMQTILTEKDNVIRQKTTELSKIVEVVKTLVYRNLSGMSSWSEFLILVILENKIRKSYCRI